MVRRSTVACSARIRSRLVSRRVIRSTGALAAMASASGKYGHAVVPRARDDRREGAIGFLAGGGERFGQRRRAQRLAARLGQHDRFGLDGGQRRRGVGPTGFDDREGAFGAQCRNDIHGRAIGNDDKRTLQRHVQIQAGRMQD